MVGGREPDQRVKVGDGLVHPIDQRPGSLGFAVTAVVKRVDRVPLGDEPVGDVLVATAVLAGAVSDDHYGAGIGIGRPYTPVDAQAPGTA